MTPILHFCIQLPLSSLLSTSTFYLLQSAILPSVLPFGPLSVTHRYIECKDGIPEEKTCPDGLLFNAANSPLAFPCQYPLEVDCTGREQTRKYFLPPQKKNLKRFFCRACSTHRRVSPPVRILPDGRRRQLRPVQELCGRQRLHLRLPRRTGLQRRDLQVRLAGPSVLLRRRR
jgi:hypothetical protein